MKLNKNYLLFLLTFFVLISILLFVISQLNREVSWQAVENVGDQFSLSLRTELDDEKENALRFAIVLAQNGEIRNALAEDDEDEGHARLKQIMNNVKKHIHTLVRAQIITADYCVFARSWDKDNLYAGMPLDVYRSDLEYFKTHREPRVSIEVGRRLGIKATVPIYEEERLLGFIEVLQFFDASTDFFHKFGIDLYVLLDESYYNTAVLMQNNPTAAWYIVANRGYNMVNLKTLQRTDFKILRKQRVLLQDNKYIFYEPMKNGQAETIGAFVFVMSKKSLEHFASTEEDISFLLTFSRANLYDIVKKEQYENKVYHSGYDKALLSLKDTVPEEDRELFMEEARDVLSSYTKEELIAMMLRYKLSRRIEGEIR
ncbi:MAG: cache domain-containing protein [Sulfurimonadaceae bacterium]